MRSLLYGLCVLCGYFPFLDLVRAEPQDIVLVDGAAFQGEIDSIVDGRATFRVAGQQAKAAESKAFALDRLVRWGNPVSPKAQPIVVLADGGQIVAAADWTGGDVVKMVGEDVVVQSELFKRVRLPRAAVCGVVFAPQRLVEDREKLVATVRGERPVSAEENNKREADFVLLANGDRVSGTVNALDGRTVDIEVSGQTAKLPIGRVEAIGFAAPASGGSPADRPQPPYVIVALRDGSMIYAKTVRATANDGEVAMLDGVELKNATAADIVAIESLSDRVAFLSDLEAADYRHVPYLTLKWPYTRDRNVLGEPIVVGGRRYWKGIGMHSAARLTYTFDREYRRLDTSVAIDDSANGRGSVVFGVYVNRDGKWVEAYKSGIVRGGEKPVAVSVDLRRAKGLTLTVDFADRGDELDRAVWLDARLVK